MSVYVHRFINILTVSAWTGRGLVQMLQLRPCQAARTSPDNIMWLGRRRRKSWADVSTTVSAQCRFVRWPNIADVGPTLGQHWDDVEPTLGQHWGDVGPTLGRSWANVFMPTICQLFTNFLPSIYQAVAADVPISQIAF